MLVDAVAFFYRLHGKGQQHGAGDEPHGAKTGQAAENGNDQHKKRRVDALPQKQGPQHIVHAGHSQHAPKGQAHGGHGFARKPERKAERQPDQGRAHHGDGGHQSGQHAPVPGNGSDENLFFALRAFCDENHPLAYADITYGCYGVWCGLMHIPSHIIPLKEDFTLDPADYYGLNETIVIANPNAPTGLALPCSAIEEILKSNPNHVVIVDEAYVDFGGESCVPLINKYENLLVVQTFSKSRQLAGARLGLAMGNAKLIADLNRVKFSLNPYNINRLTLKAGKAALEDTDYFDKTRAAIVETRDWTKQQLEARGFAVLDSRSNFLFASTDKKSGGELYLKLKEKGVLVRHFDAPRISNWLRITIGTPDDMTALLRALDEILEG